MAIGALLALGAPFASATNYEWNKGSLGNWNDAANWLPNTGTPGNADSVVTPAQFGGIALNIAAPQVTNWTFDSATSQNVLASGANATLTISDTLSKSEAGTLNFYKGASNTLDMSVGSVSVGAGRLSFGVRNNASNVLNSFSGTSADISGGALDFNVTGSAAISGTVTMSGGGMYLSQLSAATRTVSVGALSGAAGTVAANDFGNGTNSSGTLALTASSGTATFAGQLKDSGSTSAASSLALQKNNGGTQIFSGNSNTYSGGTVVNAGTLLVNNTSGSGLGTGAVSVAGGNLGGTGFINPGGANGITVASGAFLAPGASIGKLTIGMLGTTGTVDLTAGGDFKFELGTANVSIGTITPGSSDLLEIAGASAGDVAFGGGNNIDLLGTATAEGYYKLFDTSLDTTTWTGLTVGGITTGGNLITGGLTASNYGGGLSGELILGDGTAGTSAGDIYLHVVPEPATWGLLAFSLTTVLVLRRRRQG